MKEYRKKHKDKITAQNRIRGNKWEKQQVDKVSDAYIISRLCNKRVGIFKTSAEARKHPELIELTRTRILLSRLKRKINHNDNVATTRDNKRYKNRTTAMI